MTSLFTPCPYCNATGIIDSDAARPGVTVRPTDPETSHKAARNDDPRRFRDRSIQAKVLRYIADYPTSQHIVGNAVAAATGCYAESARRRASSLIEAGFARFTDRRVINPGGGGEAFVMEVTDAGRMAIRLLDEKGRTW